MLKKILCKNKETKNDKEHQGQNKTVEKHGDKKMKILGIDDNEDLLQLSEIALTSAGHEFTGISSGREGFKAIQEEKFDLVLLDLSMPDFSGLDVLDAIQKDGIINKPIIVLFTASPPSEEARKSFVEKGVHSFLSKPLEPDVLLDEIEKINSGQ